MWVRIPPASPTIKARESAGVDTRLSNELEGFETPTGRQ